MTGISWGAVVLEARTRAQLSQHDLATRAGTTQSVVGRVEADLGNPTAATIGRLLTAAGFELRVTLQPTDPGDPVVAAYRKDIDRTLLRENLKKTPEQRVRALQALVRLANEARHAGAALRRSE
jgi:transcriptional regulator with XRE-family HTH domain